MKKSKTTFRLCSLILALVFLMSFVLIGCSSSPKSSQETTVESSDNQTPAEQPKEETKEEPAAEQKPQEIYKVKVGIAPYPMYQVWVLAKEWGIDKEFGVDLELKTFASTAPGSQATVRGDVDISANCIAEHLAAIKGAPTLKHFSSVGFFKGFFYVGRKGKVKPWEELKAEMGQEAAKEYRLNEFKGKTFCIIPQRKPLILDTIAQVGLTEKDVKFMNFGDDQKAATAFLSGTGDFYIGSLPQQQKLVKMTDQFVDAGGSDILGPAGLWYDTMVSTDKFMIENREAALRTIAVMYATIREFDKDPQRFAEVASKKLSEIAGSEFTVEDYLEFQTKYDDFLSIEECKDGMYNKSSSLYWEYPVDYYVRLSIEDGHLDKEISNQEYYGEAEKLFYELLERDDLMKLINKH